MLVIVLVSPESTRIPPELFELLDTSLPLAVASLVMFVVTLLFESTVIAGCPETVIVPAVSTVMFPAVDVFSGVVVDELIVVSAKAVLDKRASNSGLRKGA